MPCGYLCACGCGQRCACGRGDDHEHGRLVTVYEGRQEARRVVGRKARPMAARHPAAGVVGCPRGCVLAMGHGGACVPRRETTAA